MTAGAIALIVAYIALFLGYFINIGQLISVSIDMLDAFGGQSTPAIGMIGEFFMRVVGVVIPPIGGAIGWVGIF